MTLDGSDSGASTITQSKHNKIITPFYAFWNILGEYHNATEEYRPTIDQVNKARSEFLEALSLSTNGEACREEYEGTAHTREYLDNQFTRDHYLVLMVIAVEWRLDWKDDIKPNVFKDRLHYKGAKEELKPIYRALEKNFIEQRKQWRRSMMRNPPNAAQSSEQQGPQSSGDSHGGI